MPHQAFFGQYLRRNVLSRGANVAEIGSGAGFPSLPLKIVRDDLSFALVESVEKKCVFLREAVKELGLKNIQVIHMRAEDGGKNRAYREKFDVCCARAVARLNTLSEYCVPFVKIGGRFIAYKGSAEEELREAENAFRVLGVKTVACERYDLPEEMVSVRSSSRKNFSTRGLSAR